jgi:hypothetical protein
MEEVLVEESVFYWWKWAQLLFTSSFSMTTATMIVVLAIGDSTVVDSVLPFVLCLLDWLMQKVVFDMRHCFVPLNFFIFFVINNLCYTMITKKVVYKHLDWIGQPVIAFAVVASLMIFQVAVYGGIWYANKGKLRWFKKLEGTKGGQNLNRVSFV